MFPLDMFDTVRKVIWRYGIMLMVGLLGMCCVRSF